MPDPKDRRDLAAGLKTTATTAPWRVRQTRGEGLAIGGDDPPGQRKDQQDQGVDQGRRQDRGRKAAP